MEPHGDQKVLENDRGGDVSVVMIHGRGATAESIMRLSEQLPDAHYYAPQAAGREWYPRSFLEPREANQPELDSALEKIDTIVEEIGDREKTVLLGFSQGACLASEYASRNPERFGGLVLFSGGLIGDQVRDYSGDLEGTPAFIGCSENDPHIPRERVEETADVLEDLGADLEKKLYPGSSHEVNSDEMERARKLIGKV